MIVSFDYFGRYETPVVTLCNPSSVAIYEDDKVVLTNPIGCLPNPKGMSGEFNTGSYSEISFDINRNTTPDDVFQKAATYMSLYLEGIGYFIISECTESRYNNDIVVSKSIKARSSEVEISRFEAPHIKKGVYKFRDVIDLCATLSPKWKFNIERFENSLLDLDRFFVEEDYENLHSFLIEKLQDRYDCIFEFDIINREVYAVSKQHYVDTHMTDIHIANHNLINKLEKSSSVDDIYTALKVTGGNDLDIRAVNPIGTNIIYNFEYRKPWMSNELKEALDRWTAKVSSVENSKDFNNSVIMYAAAQDDLQTAITKQTQCQEELNAANINLDSCIANNLATTDDYKAAKQRVVDAKNNLKTAESDVADKKVLLSAYQKNLDKITQECSLSVSAKDINDEIIFTPELLEELSSYINTGEYPNENFTQTDEMKYTEKLQQARLLMADGKGQLEKVSTENFKFTVDTNDFIFNENFAEFTKQLIPGCIVWAESEEDKFEQFHISTISVDFEDETSTLTFSNKYNKYDIKSLFDDVFGSVSKSASTIKRLVGIIEDQQKQLAVTKDWIDNAMTLTAGHVLSSKDQDVIISETGYWGRKLQRDDNGNILYDATKNPLYDEEQIKIINNGVYITEDNWGSVSTAIGKIVIGEDDDGNPIYKFGVAGDVIIGRLLLGNGLYITAENKNGDTATKIDGDGVKIYNGAISIYSDFSETENSKILGTDASGNIYVKGTIDASGGNVGGWSIDDYWLYSKPNGKPGTGMAAHPNGSSVAFWAGYNGTKETPFADENWESNTKFFVKSTGEMYAEFGYIGGWEIGKDYIRSENDTYRFYLTSKGSSAQDWIRAYNKKTDEDIFKVSKAGTFYARNADIEGKITATSGEIGRCKISGGVLQIANANIGSLSVSKLTAGTNTQTVKFSGDFTATNATITGTIYANDGYLKGRIEADEGYIGDWEIYNGSLVVYSADYKIILSSTSITREYIAGGPGGGYVAWTELIAMRDYMKEKEWI